MEPAIVATMTESTVSDTEAKEVESKGGIEDDIAGLIADECIDEIAIGISHEVHRAGKLGYLFLDDFNPEEQKRYEIIVEPNKDVFGNPLTTNVQFECECPKCGRTLAASRFAPHLEKCIGKGRNSSRIASRRIAKNIATMSGDTKDSDMDEVDNHDSDWTGVRKQAPRTRTTREGGTHLGKGRRPKAASKISAAAAAAAIGQHKNPSLAALSLAHENPESVGSSNGSEGSGSYGFETISYVDANEEKRPIILKFKWRESQSQQSQS